MSDLTDDQVCALLANNELRSDSQSYTVWSLARALLQARADAAAAQALMVQKAAGIAERHWEGEPEDTIAMGDEIRALATDAGTAELTLLRGRAEKAEAALAERKTAPVQGFTGGIPWKMHLRAYDAYCKKYQPQKALIEGGCRGGFGVKELDMFIPGWRDELSAIRAVEVERDTLAASLAAQTALVETLTGALRETREKAHSMAHDEYDGVWSEQDFRDYTPLADAALEAAEIATMTPEQRADYKRAVDMRAVAKGIAEGQGK